ncbi:MAG: complex I NDUFA9 subunit family protein [Reyranellaceae bacterium]
MGIAQVTVFGGSGFIGRHIVRRLAQRGLRVRAAVRRPELADFLKPMGDVGQVVPVQANLRHARSVQEAVAGSQAVVNATGIQVQRGRQRYQAVHVEGVRSLGEAGRKAGIERLVHISGLGADAADAAENAFVRSKIEGEKALREAFPTATILRPSVVFGPEDAFINNMAVALRLAPFMPAIGGDHTRFQPVYVGDVAAAVLACLDRPETEGQVFELGGPTVYTMRQIAELILQATGRRMRIVNLPFSLARLVGLVGQFLPNPPLTFDQALLLEADSVVQPSRQGLAELGIAPTAAEVILPTYLDRFRVGGRYTTHAA